MKKLIYTFSIIFICVFTILFTGCDESFTDFTLHFSTESIELNLGEESTYVITIGNYKETEIKFNFDFDKNIAEIDKDSIEDLGKGKFRITVNTLMSGSTTLTITLLQNNKTLNIPVNVYESIKGLSIKPDYASLYVLRGESLTFNSDMFIFSPPTTLQKDLIFSVNAVELENNQLITDETTPDLVTVNAKSIHNENLSVDFEVNVLDRIDLAELEGVYLKMNEEILQPIGVDENGDPIGDVIEIIANDKDEYIKQLEFIYDIGFDYDILSENGNIYIQTSSSAHFENSKYIDIQYTDSTRQLFDTLIIRISHKHFDSYYVELKYYVEIKLIPKALKLNGETQTLYVNMFDGSNIDDKIDILMSVEPLKATYSKVRLEFYGVKNQEGGGETADPIDYTRVKNYVCIMYNGLEITDMEIEDITHPISVYGRATMGETYDYIRVKVICESPLLNQPISNYINMSIYKAATDFYIDDTKYENSTLYVKNGTQVEFSDFVIIEPDAYIGKISAIPDYLSAGYVEITQTEENSKTIIIRALKPGQATYTLILSNGISTKIKIIVKEELDLDNFMLYVSSNAQQGIAEVEYKEVGKTNSLSYVAIRGDNVEFDISYTILPKNIDTDMYSYTLESTDRTLIRIDNNRIIRTLKTAEYPCRVKVTLKYIVIEDFKKVEKDVADLGSNAYNYDFQIECFEPISSFRLLGLNSGTVNSAFTDRVDVYDDTGYIDQRLSNISLGLWIDGEQVNVDPSTKREIAWSFSVEQGDPETDAKGEYYELTEYGGSVIFGRFYPELMEFVCDGRENVGEAFTITAQIEEHGKIWASRVQINIKKYEQVTSVWLSNYQETIYLDVINNSVTLYPYIVPSIATNKNFIVQFLPDANTSSSSLNITYDANSIRVNYNGFGGGTGTLKIIPNSKFISESEYSYSLDIKVEIGDGTQENPLHINSFKEFKQIDVTKYYVIETIIDAQGETLEPFAELTGGIEGKNGGIKNFTISNYMNLNDEDEVLKRANYYGLFPKVYGYIKNLSVSGNIQIQDAANTETANYIGLVCGQNNGLIENVNVTLLNSNILVDGNNKNYVGAVCGKNKGSIVIDITSKDIASTLMVYMPDDELFSLTLNYEEGNYSFGGVAGYNRGVIEFKHPAVFNKYNYYGTTSVVNIDVNVINYNVANNKMNSGVGGVVGYNKAVDNNTGFIKNLLACGTVNRKSVNSYHPNNVGGLVGYSESGEITKNISRVFVSGRDNVGGLVGFAYGGKVINNTVQAVDDAYKIGLDASLILSYAGTIVDPIANVNPTVGYNNNVSETYFIRTLVNSTSSAIMTIDNYYGDLVKISSDAYNGIRFQVNPESGEKTLENLYNKAGKYPNRTIVLSYYLAQNAANQKYLDVLNVQRLPNDLFVDIMEIKIESSNPSIISITPVGELVLHGTGTVNLTITSILKVNDKLELVVHVVNYVSGVDLYRNSDRQNGAISDLDILEISNRNAYTLYPKFTSTIEIGNTIIETVECSQAKLEIYGNDDYVTINQTGGTVILRGNGLADTTETQEINYYVYLKLSDTDKRYLQLTANGYEFIPYTTVPELDITLDSLGCEPNFTMLMNYNQGIYDIKVDKVNLTVAPIDIIELTVEYSTFDANDEIVFEIYYENGVDYLDTDAKIATYFNVLKTEKELVNGKYYIHYTISMNTQKIRLGNYKFIFSGADSSVYKDIRVNYIEQPVNNIIVNNYTEIDNRDIIVEQLADGSYVYNTSYTMQETNTLTAGKTNILRINIEPAFANYSYIEITNDAQNIANGKLVMFSLLKQYTNGAGEPQENQAIVSADSYYINNGIRIYKSAISNGQLSVLYTISSNITEGEEIKINLNFYDENRNMVYPQQQKSLEVAVDKSISVKIPGREKYLARGRKYVLDVKALGYKDNEVFISSNSPYAKIERDADGTYFVQIADSVSYGVGEGAVFSISYYGERLVNGSLVKSSQGNIEYTIVEYVAESLDIQDMFNTDTIVLNVNNKINDIRDEIIKKVELEYSSDATNAVMQLKATLKSSGTYFYKLSSGNAFELLIGDGDDKTEVKNDKYVEIDGYKVTPKFVGENTFYLGIYARLEYYGGYLRVVTLDEDFDFETVDKKSFAVIANQRTSEDKELPIKTYKEFTQMSEGNNYVLMNDIIIESAYVPLDVAISSFDGNGYKIIFRGSYENTDTEAYGLFKNIYPQTTIKNVTIEIAENSTAMFDFYNTNLAAPLIFGLLASKNEGVVYNCVVQMANANASIKASNTSSVTNTTASYISAFVAQNDGYITNSRVEVKIECNGANLAGFVAVNNGHIAGCYVKNSLIKNTSTDVNNSTGGFVITNTKKIVSCFIEGSYSSTVISMYADDPNYIVRASSIAGTFVYNNTGYISDCYSNIPIVSSSRNSGFVCINEGQIQNCYTTSRLGDKDTENYPFFISNTGGTIKNSYFLSDTNFNVSVSKLNDGLPDDVLRATSLLEFATRHKIMENNKVSNQKLFSSFVINSNNDNQSGVWFYATDTDTFDKHFSVGDIISAGDYNKYVANTRFVEAYNYVYQNKVQKFAANRPQLVSANTLAYSQREIVEETYKEETGETEYVFSTDNLGTKYNPYIITKARQLENIILDNSVNDVCSSYIRIIKDLDYSEEQIVVSSLYRTVFTGYIEGNDLTISGFSLNNNESLLNAGFFSQIGNGVESAVLQNLTFAPKYINLPNSYNVGTVAGTVYKANIYNITVDGYKNNPDGMVVMGRDIVGGVFGRTIYDYDISNLSSSISVNAYLTCSEQDWTTDTAQDRILYSELKGNNATVAYSGAIIGYVGGYGKLHRVSITDSVASIGMVSGLMFGGIGMEAVVTNIHYTPQGGINNFIRASVYGGVIVGDLRGEIKDVSVNKPTETFNLFKNEPILPQAIGGAVGIVRGGKITDCAVNIDISPNKLTTVIGGIVGKVIQSCTLENCDYLGSLIKGKQVVGGLIGELKANPSLEINVQINNCQVGAKDKPADIMLNKLASESDILKVYAGTVIGAISGHQPNFKNEDDSGPYIKILIKEIDLYANVKVDMKMYGQESDKDSDNYEVWAGGIVGGYLVEDDAYESAVGFWGHDDNANRVTINNSSNREMIINMDIQCKNLIYGDNQQKKLAYGYVVRYAIVNYNSEPTNKTSLDITVELNMQYDDLENIIYKTTDGNNKTCYNKYYVTFRPYEYK